MKEHRIRVVGGVLLNSASTNSSATDAAGADGAPLLTADQNQLKRIILLKAKILRQQASSSKSSFSDAAIDAAIDEAEEAAASEVASQRSEHKHNSSRRYAEHLQDRLEKRKQNSSRRLELNTLFDTIDADGDGGIGFGEYEVLWGPKLDAFCARQSRAVFDRIDMDGSGEISAVEMKGAMARLPAATQAQLWPVMKELDSNGSGVVEFPGFEVMLTSWIKQKLEKGLALALNPVKIGGWGSKQAFDHIDTDASGGM
jgi:hypothetical protein